MVEAEDAWGAVVLGHEIVLACHQDISAHDLERLVNSQTTILDAHCTAKPTFASILHLISGRAHVNLTQISFKNARLGLECLHELFVLLPSTHVTGLNLARNALGACGVSALCSSPALRCLQDLDLSFNQIGRKGAAHLAKVLRQTPPCTLQSLALESNYMGNAGLRVIAKALQRPNALHCLAVGKNTSKMHARTLQEFACAIVAGKMQELGLDMDVDCFNALNVALMHPNCALHKLELVNSAGATMMSDEEEDVAMQFVDPTLFSSFLRALAHEQCKITNLKLLGFPLGYRCMSRLCGAVLRADRKIRSLSISRGYIGTIGARAVELMLANANCHLTDLALANNYVGNRGVQYIARALASEHCKLERLDLSFNLVSGNVVAYDLIPRLRVPHSRISSLILKEDEDDQEDDEEEEDSVWRNAQKVENTLHNMKLARNLLALMSAKSVPRIASRAAPLCRLPNELFKLLACVLVVV